MFDGQKLLKEAKKKYKVATLKNELKELKNKNWKNILQ